MLTVSKDGLRGRREASDRTVRDLLSSVCLVVSAEEMLSEHGELKVWWCACNQSVLRFVPGDTGRRAKKVLSWPSRSGSTAT